jgi:SMC interacting uncharacterized protein involved in chromosome segregation
VETKFTLRVNNPEIKTRLVTYIGINNNLINLVLKDIMGLNDYLEQQLHHALARQKKAEEISKAVKELNDVCGELTQHTKDCNAKLFRSEDLSDADKEKSNRLNERYNSCMEKMKNFRYDDHL